jgi:hypothetical protein
MSELSRRSVLGFAGALGLGALGATVAPGRVDAAVARSGLQRLTRPAIGSRASFARLLGTTLTATGSAGRRQLTLTRILDAGETGAAGDEQSFNLILQDASAADFSEGIYRLSSPALPATSLFLSPVGPAGRDQRIQALVNRPRRTLH